MSDHACLNTTGFTGLKIIQPMRYGNSTVVILPTSLTQPTPSNNLYISGITKGQSYYPDGDWTKFRSRINSLNLSEQGY